MNSRGIYKKWKERSHQQVSTHGEENSSAAGKRIYSYKDTLLELPSVFFVGWGGHANIYPYQNIRLYS